MCRITITFHSRKSKKQNPVTPVENNPRPRNHLHEMENDKIAPVPSSIYMHSAYAVISNSPSNKTSILGGAMPPHSVSDAEFVDHYAVLGLDCWATSEEVKDKYRSLRSEYFTTEHTKYRALLAAYGVLVDTEARWNYDKQYRKMRGLPSPPAPSALDGSRRPTPPVSRVQTQVQSLERESPKPQKVEVARDNKQVQTQIQSLERKSMTPLKVEVAQPVKQIHDKNFAIKNHVLPKSSWLVQGQNPTGIPISAEYSKHPKLMCSKPKYVQPSK